MNRELKFRIWDKSHDEFIIENGHGFHCYSNWSIDIFSGKLVDYVGAHDGDHSDTFIQHFAPDHFISPKKGFVKECPFIIQQYTGLKDKNGKEIYEGDILEYKWKNGFKFYYKVYWLDTTASFEITPLSEYEYPDDMSEPILSWLNLSNLEIVGNIYENAELLK